MSESPSISFLSHFQSLAERILGQPLAQRDGVQVPPALVMPQALRDLYTAFGKVAALTTSHNKLLAPTRLTKKDGKIVFYEENQGLASWAFNEEDASLSDPTVHQGNATENGWEWHSEEVSLSKWAEAMTYWQVVNGGFPFIAYAESVTKALTLVTPQYTALCSFAGGDVKFYGTGAQIACVAGDNAGASVWIGARTPEDFAEMDQALGIEWDYTTLDEL